MSDAIRSLDFLLDGTNVCGWGQQTDANQFSLSPLMTLIVALRTLRGGKVLCIFDANTRFRLREVGQEHLYEELLRIPSTFVEVTGGIRADDFLLQEANQSHCQIISNDRYRDYQSRYPWLAKEKMLVKGGILAGKIAIPHLELSIPISPSPDKLLPPLKHCLEPEYDTKHAAIEKAWIDPIACKDSKWGVGLHAAFTLRGYRKAKCALVFRFYDATQRSLRSRQQITVTICEVCLG